MQGLGLPGCPTHGWVCLWPDLATVWPIRSAGRRRISNGPFRPPARPACVVKEPVTW